MSSSEAPYAIETADGCCVVAIRPALNESPWAEIERIGSEILQELREDKRPACLVDLSELDYMGSALVALVVRVWKAVQEQGGRMVVVNRHPMVYEVLRLAGLTKVWTIVETREEAVRQLGVRMRSSAGTGPRGGTWLIVLGILGLIGAGAGLFLLQSSVDIDRRVALGIQVGCSAIAMIVGTIASNALAGMRRGLGILIVLASLALLLVGVLRLS